MSDTQRAQPWVDAETAAREMERRLSLKVLRKEPLAEHTTMRVGGPADLLVTIRDRFALRGLVRLAASRGWPLLVLGRGSNVVVGDAGIRGIVALNRSAGYDVDQAAGTISFDSGVPMAKASTIAAEAGLTGLEFALAIPGNIGGAIWANAGAHGGEMAAITTSVTLLRADGTEVDIPAADAAFAYRESRFKRPEGSGEVILGASVALQQGEPDLIKAHLEEIRRWRREHQPLGIPSAGSVFRNPPGGQSAGALIEAAGMKGVRIGGAEVAEMHANWILNRGGATAADIRALHDACRDAVQAQHGITLATEIAFIGEFAA
ncbi:MAG: UDP-N-acetylmuramate dehydrogenase [Candidatus Limnocylindrus sp.]